jgi:hypothetical protein
VIDHGDIAWPQARYERLRASIDARDTLLLPVPQDGVEATGPGFRVGRGGNLPAWARDL